MSKIFWTLPHDLMKVIDQAGQKYGADLRSQLTSLPSAEGEVVNIDFPFSLNYRMFDLSEIDAESVGQLRLTDPSAYDRLCWRIYVHLFGDNIRAYRDHYWDASRGSCWSLRIRNIWFEGGWLVVTICLAEHQVNGGDQSHAGFPTSNE